MSTIFTASNVNIIHQGNENGCTEAYRAEICDPATHVRGAGYGASAQEAYNAARVDFQDAAACFTRLTLRDAQEGFERLLKQQPILA